MKHYYYADNGQQLGPFTFDELKAKRLKKSTLIWTEGMQDWTIANEIEELKSILISEPPPLPKKTSESSKTEIIQIKKKPVPNTNSKYDLTYEKETDATLVGIVIIITSILLMIFKPFQFDNIGDYNQFQVISSISSLVLRIFTTVWVVNIATRQNRNSTGWGWFAFFFPSITLVIIGLLKKLRLKIELDDNLPINQQVSILLNKADKLFLNSRYQECVEILDKAIEIENHNFECIELRGIANYHMKNYEKSKSDFEILLKNEKFLSDTYYYLGNIANINKDRELAVSYWLKADELKNENAKIKLDNFHTYTGNYLLDSSQVMKKIKDNSSSEYTYLGGVKYLGGLLQIDQIEKSNSLKTLINIYTLGLDIELKRTFKTYHLAISYYEIDNIIYKVEEKLFELHLVDNNILTFSYDHTKDIYNELSYNNDVLKQLFDKFKAETGKTVDIL